MKSIQFNGSEESWNWSDIYHSRAAFIGHNQDSNKQDCLKAISKKIIQKDKKSVFWITPNRGDIQGDVTEVFDLAAYETLPNSKEAGNENFSKQRMEFLQLYLNLLAEKKGEARTDLIPLGSYLPSQEGAFVGYVRAAEKMDNEEKKAYLLKEFSKLTNVLWVYVEDKGYHYIYEETESEAETLLNFLVGCWAFWSYTSILQEETDLLLIIDIPSSLTQLETTPKIKQQIIEVLSLMNNLTYDVTCTAIFSSETFFPIPELNIRHHFYWKYDSKDFDWTLSDNEAYFEPSLIQSWKEGGRERAMWADLSDQKKSVITFETENDILFQNVQSLHEGKNSD